jgi:PAS domain S-box-containing protein
MLASLKELRRRADNLRLREIFSTAYARSLMIVGLVLLPMLIAIGALGVLYSDAERRVIEARRSDVATNAALIIDRLIAERIGALQTLASSMSGEPFDSPDAQQRAASVAERFGEAVVLIDRTGKFIWSTRLPPGGLLPERTDLPPVAPAFADRKPYVSNMITGAFTDLPLAIVTVPLSGEQAGYALSMSISPNLLSSTLKQAGLPDEWVAAIVDRNGVFVARSHSPELNVGQPARPQLIETARGGLQSGSFKNVTHEGVPVESSFQRSDLTGWTAVVAVPEALMNAASDRSRIIVLLSLIAAVLLALLLAAIAGRSTIAAVQALQRNALALAKGEPLHWKPHSISEFNDVGKTLMEAEGIIKERDRAVAELQRTSELLQSIITLTPDLVYVKDADSKTILTNPATLRLYGKTLDDVKGRGAIDWHPNLEEVERIVENDRLVMAQGESMQFEEAFTGIDGRRVFLSTKTPLRDQSGQVIGVVGVSTDVTDREKRAQHVEFIMRELSHRSKNLLTVIQSIARQTAKQSLGFDEFQHSFDSRLQSLAALHDLLIEHNWEGASIAEVVRSQLKPFANRDRVDAEGADVFLKPDVAQMFAMAFHELATNATKYGALSLEGGRVAIRWGVTGGQFRIEWREQGGPAVTPPARDGFGSTVLKRIASQVAQARIDYEFDSTGVVWRLEAPLSLVEAVA